MPNKNTLIKVAVKCQCQNPAIPRPPTLLQTVQCKNCGKIYKTNRNLKQKGLDICFNCKNSR